MFVWTLFFVFALTHGQIDRDWSFDLFCKFWGGKYRNRADFNENQGDKCEIEFAHATDGNDEAMRYCEFNVPYHILEAIPGLTTKCKAEATLICKREWVQMFGRCYKMTRKMMAREEAGKHCKDQTADVGRDVQVAFMHRESLPFRINDYFTQVSQLWIDASEAITNDLIYNKPNGHLLLALDGYRYSLPNIALARVSPTDKAFALCEYSPVLTRSESNYLLKRFGEIYYPTVSTDEGSYIRTASARNHVEDNESADNDYCTKVMKPFIPDTLAQSAVPTATFINEVNRLHEGSPVIIRTSAHSKDSSQSKRKNPTCVSNINPIHEMALAGSNSKYRVKNEWRSGQPVETCDAGSWSTAIVTGRDGTSGLETMSDARYAPIYCQAVVKTFKYEDCPTGFHLFKRERGVHWCHKFFEERKNNENAELECQKHGAHLTGYTSPEELKLLSKLIGNYYGPPTYSQDTWLGGHRKSECKIKGSEAAVGYVKDPNDPCSRKVVFQWSHGVAPNPPDIEADWDRDYEPNHYDGNESCLALLKTDQTQGTIRMSLNDYNCGQSYQFICGREAPISLI